MTSLRAADTDAEVLERLVQTVRPEEGLISAAIHTDPDVLLVHAWEGAPLPVEHGGPCRMITPKLYAWKGTKWIRKIEFLAGNKPGFWEERGYSDTAEPWFDDRYSE